VNRASSLRLPHPDSRMCLCRRVCCAGSCCPRQGASHSRWRAQRHPCTRCRFSRFQSQRLHLGHSSPFPLGVGHRWHSPEGSQLRPWRRSNVQHSDGVWHYACFSLSLQPLTPASFGQALTFDSDDTLYVSDMGNQRICKLSAPNFVVSTLAGGGSSSSTPAPDAPHYNVEGEKVMFKDGKGAEAR
jgi:hypothetical protein